MKVKDAVKHFGSGANVARTLGIHESQVSRWKSNNGNVPLKHALKLNNYTGGALDLNLRDYQ